MYTNVIVGLINELSVQSKKNDINLLEIRRLIRQSHFWRIKQELHSSTSNTSFNACLKYQMSIL